MNLSSEYAIWALPSPKINETHKGFELSFCQEIQKDLSFDDLRIEFHFPWNKNVNEMKWVRSEFTRSHKLFVMLYLLN